MNYNAIDLFSGCGGLTLGMRRAGFAVSLAVEMDSKAVATYKLNHRETIIINDDIRNLTVRELKKSISGKRLHLLAGCPPCQGFSAVRRLNKKRNKRDPRNSLIREYLRLVEGLRPLTIMLENVPGLLNYYLFPRFVAQLESVGYLVDFKVVDAKEFGVPQSRRRLALVGSLLGTITVANPAMTKPPTVRETIGSMVQPHESNDWLHRVVANHTPSVLERIKLTPPDGGSRKDLPEKYTLSCHNAIESGFNDVYGRLRWDAVASTITGGCLNPSKGRFLHPEQDRCISAREASLLQSFPPTYRFAEGTTKTDLAVMIGNALPPMFSYHQSVNIREHLIKHLHDKPSCEQYRERI